MGELFFVFCCFHCFLIIVIVVLCCYELSSSSCFGGVVWFVPKQEWNKKLTENNFNPMNKVSNIENH